jgi:hypothetical protein
MKREYLEILEERQGVVSMEKYKMVYIHTYLSPN